LQRNEETKRGKKPSATVAVGKCEKEKRFNISTLVFNYILEMGMNIYTCKKEWVMSDLREGKGEI